MTRSERLMGFHILTSQRGLIRWILNPASYGSILLSSGRRVIRSTLGRTEVKNAPHRSQTELYFRFPDQDLQIHFPSTCVILSNLRQRYHREYPTYPSLYEKRNGPVLHAI